MRNCISISVFSATTSRPDNWLSVENLKSFFSRKRSNALPFKMVNNRHHPFLDSISALSRGYRTKTKDNKYFCQKDCRTTANGMTESRVCALKQQQKKGKIKNSIKQEAHRPYSSPELQSQIAITCFLDWYD